MDRCLEILCSGLQWPLPAILPFPDMNAEWKSGVIRGNQITGGMMDDQKWKYKLPKFARWWAIVCQWQ